MNRLRSLAMGLSITAILLGAAHQWGPSVDWSASPVADWWNQSSGSVSAVVVLDTEKPSPSIAAVGTWLTEGVAEATPQDRGELAVEATVVVADQAAKDVVTPRGCADGRCADGCCAAGVCRPWPRFPQARSTDVAVSATATAPSVERTACVADEERRTWREGGRRCHPARRLLGRLFCRRGR